MPAVAAEAGGAVRCVRCRRLLGGGEANAPHRRGVAELADHGLELDKRLGSSTDSSEAWTAPPRSADLPSAMPQLSDGWEDWLLATELQRVRRRFDLPASRAATAIRDRPGDRTFIAAPLHAPRQEPAARHSARPNGRRSSPLVMGALSLGLMAFVCGGVLLGWSVFSGRNELWNVGLPIALAGQFGLLLGLLLQLDFLGEGSRRATDRLEEVDQRLDCLQQAALEQAPPASIEHWGEPHYGNLGTGRKPKHSKLLSGGWASTAALRE
jgi:hypothetical protein